MDRAEQTGLGLALIGHLGLLGALSLALVTKQDMPKLDAEPLTVELIDDGAAGLSPMSPAPSPDPDAQSAPLPSDAPPAPPEISAAEIAAQQAAAAAQAKAAAAAQSKAAAAAAASQKAAADAAKRAKAAADAAQKSQANAAAKLAAQKAAADAKLAKQRAEAAKATVQKAEAQRRAKAEADKRAQQAALNAAAAKAAANKAAAAKAAAAKAAAAKAAKEKAAREAASKAGTGGTGLREIKLGGDDKPKGNAMSTAQAQQVVDTSLAAAIQPRFRRCAPTGVDVELIITRIKIDLNRDGSVANVGVLGQTGINESNQTQAELLKSCAVKAVRTAAPFTTLPVAHYELWKSMTKRLKTR